MSIMDGNRFLDAVDQRWQVYREQLLAARQATTEETIHDLRVAARRMLAMLAILRSVDAQAPTKKLHRSLKDQLDELDELRDAQVMLVETAHMLEKIPQLAPIQVYEFQMYLEKGEKDLIHKAQIDLGASRPAEVERRFQKLRFAAEGHIRDELLLDKLLASVDEAQAKVARAGHDPPCADRFQEFPVHDRDRPSLPAGLPGEALEMHARLPGCHGEHSRCNRADGDDQEVRSGLIPAFRRRAQRVRRPEDRGVLPKTPRPIRPGLFQTQG
jgi:hypothetical protein